MDAHWQGEPGFGTTTGKEDSPTRKISQIVLKCIAQCSSWRSPPVPCIFIFLLKYKLFAQHPRMTAARSKNMNRKISDL